MVLWNLCGSMYISKLLFGFLFFFFFISFNAEWKQLKLLCFRISAVYFLKINMQQGFWDVITIEFIYKQFIFMKQIYFNIYMLSKYVSLECYLSLHIGLFFASKCFYEASALCEKSLNFWSQNILKIWKRKKYSLISIEQNKVNFQ